MNFRCPDPGRLASYAHGELTEPAASEVADHVEQCNQCETTVVNMERQGDTVVSALRKTPAADPLVEEPQCQRAMELVQEIGRDPATVDLARSAGSDGQTRNKVTGNAQLREYKLLEKLGEGGMGAVHKALHTKLKRIVALKVLPSDRLKDPHAVSRFEREMEAVGKLDHPHIVRAMDAGEHDGTHFLVMEYVEGGDLSQLVKERGPLPIAQACEYIRQAAVGLQYAHENGLVHRDIKPSNLMLAVGSRLSATICQSGSADSQQPAADSPLVKILDLGLALLSDKHQESPVRELTSTGQMMGTLDYMAPEQGSDSHIVDARADIYSLGATLYKLLTGEVIYTGERYKTPVQKMMALATVPAPDVRTRRSDVPEALAQIVARMLEKDADKRPANAGEVAALLAPFASSSIAPTAKPAAVKPPVRSSHPVTPSPIHVVTKPAVKRPHANSPPWLPIAIGGGLLGLGGILALAATIFYFQTASGTLRVEVQGAETEVRVKGTDIVITAEGDEQPIKLRAGEHSLVVTRGDFTFETSNFELKRGETSTVKVELLPGEIRVVRDGAVIGRSHEEQPSDHLVTRFAPDAPTIDRDHVTPEEGGWRLSATGDRTVRMFEFPRSELDNSTIVYRAQLKTRDVGKRAYLELWCVMPADSSAPGEYFSKGLDSALAGTNGWTAVEIPFFVKRGQIPDAIKLNVVIEGGGVVWIKDVELRQRPLPPSKAAPPATAYDRFAIGKWTQALNTAEKIPQQKGVSFANGVLTLDDAMIRDNSPDSVQATDVIVRAQVKGVGSVTARCTDGNIGFWLGDGFVGINRNDPEGTVLASRNYPVDLTQFHELALASIGDRHMAFIDGRRVLDTVDDKWRVRGPILIHSHQTKGEYKNIEIMSLDGLKVGDLLPDRDPLAKWVGTWDTEWTTKTEGQPDKVRKGVMLIAHTELADFYSAMQKMDDGSSSLYVYKYLPEDHAIRTWTFLSNGLQDVFDKQIDPATGVQTVPPRERENGVTETGTMRSLDDNTSEVRFVSKSADGRQLWESIGVQKRRDPRTPFEQVDITAGGPAKEAPELAVLAPLVGRWDVDIVIKPSKFTAEETQQKAIDEFRWVLGGHFLIGQGQSADGKLTNFWLSSYDLKKKAYAATMFQETGTIQNWLNSWNERTRTLEGIDKAAPQGWAGMGGNRLIDNDRNDAWWTMKDDRGELIFEMTSTRTRIASPEASAPPE